MLHPGTDQVNELQLRWPPPDNLRRNTEPDENIRRGEHLFRTLQIPAGCDTNPTGQRRMAIERRRAQRIRHMKNGIGAAAGIKVDVKQVGHLNSPYGCIAIRPSRPLFRIRKHMRIPGRP